MDMHVFVILNRQCALRIYVCFCVCVCVLFVEAMLNLKQTVTWFQWHRGEWGAHINGPLENESILVTVHCVCVCVCVGGRG